VPHVRLRILSDLHFAEPASRITDLRMIEPLLDGPGRLIFNGDSIDTRFLETNPGMAAGHERFLKFIAPLGQRLTLVTGNHDPDISPHHHLELAGGRVLVTHGDVLFPSVAPWGWEASHVLVARQHRLAEIAPQDHGRFETQLEVCKHASYATRHLSPSARQDSPGPWTRLLHLATRVRRADQILTAWFHTPTLAAKLADQHRPDAAVIIIGHTHFPGLWRRGRRTVINTGAFTPPFAPRVVDFVDDRIEVRRVVKTGGDFRLGPIVHQLELGREIEDALP